MNQKTNGQVLKLSDCVKCNKCKIHPFTWAIRKGIRFLYVLDCPVCRKRSEGYFEKSKAIKNWNMKNGK